jgi:hypothetical protein
MRALFLAFSVVLIPFGAHGATKLEGSLPRDADLGFTTAAEGGELRVRSVVASAPAATALQEGDVLLVVNGREFERPYEGLALLDRLDGAKEAVLRIRRSAAEMEARFTPAVAPLRELDGFDLTYGEVKTRDGARLRTIVARPQSLRGKRPAVFFTQFTSCIPAERWLTSSAGNELAIVARELGLIILIAERASDGDSEGPACHELGYNQEVAHYADSLQSLARSAGVDRRKIFIYGSSLGATTAPLVAREFIQRGGAIAGIAVQGGGALTHFERMLNFDRHYLERRQGAVPRSIHDEMNRRAAFHVEYLVKGRNPDEVAEDSPDMAAVRRDVRGLGHGHHYGRPYRWHQEAATRNFLQAWLDVAAPVLVVFNEFDQFESERGHRLIVDAVNRELPGRATFVKQAGLGHSNYRHASVEAAYAGEGGTRDIAPLTSALRAWLKRVLMEK